MKRIFFVASLILGSAPVLSQAQSDEAALAMGRLLEHHLRRASTVADYHSRIIQAGAEMDVDGVPGLTIADYAQFGLIQRAGSRATELVTFLSNDLDGDGVVTKDEVLPRARALASRKPESERVAAIEETVSKAMQNDANGDGMVTVQEYNIPASGTRFRLVQRTTLNWMELFARFDTNSDGVTSFDEVGALVDAALHQIDANNDDELTDDEIAAFHAQLKAAGQFKPEPTLMPQIEAYVAALP